MLIPVHAEQRKRVGRAISTAVKKYGQEGLEVSLSNVHRITETSIAWPVDLVLEMLASPGKPIYRPAFIDAMKDCERLKDPSGGRFTIEETSIAAAAVRVTSLVGEFSELGLLKFCVPSLKNPEEQLYRGLMHVVQLMKLTEISDVFKEAQKLRCPVDAGADAVSGIISPDHFLAQIGDLAARVQGVMIEQDRLRESRFALPLTQKQKGVSSLALAFFEIFRHPASTDRRGPFSRFSQSFAKCVNIKRFGKELIAQAVQRERTLSREAYGNPFIYLAKFEPD